jgi:ATP-dependent exoDNAse (exonuclease V) beta subunit
MVGTFSNCRTPNGNFTIGKEPVVENSNRNPGAYILLKKKNNFFFFPQIIIYSCTKSDNLSTTTPQTIKENEILEDKRRLTVAITRSKQKLIIISDVTAVQKYTPFNEMFQKMSSVSKIKLEEGRMGFRWESILTSLENLLDDDSSNNTL